MLDRPNLNNLPIEIALEICSHLSLEDIPSTIIFNKEYNNQIQKSLSWNMFWKDHFKRHFPHLLEIIEITNDTNWYVEFRKAYDDEYHNLPLRIKKLFSFVKEGDILSFKNNLQLVDLNMTDKYNYSLINWTIETKNQKLLDCIYEIATKEYATGMTVDTSKTDSRKRTILHWAAACNQPSDMIDSLILQGANVDAAMDTGVTPLSIAADMKHSDIVTVLLANNANVNKATDYGETPLFITAENGDIDIVNVLLANNARINAARHNRATPLYVAAQNGHIDIVNVLLANNARINAARRNGATPLHVAAQNGHTDIVKALLANNANINATRRNGTTPFEIAMIKGHKDIAKAISAAELISYDKKIKNQPDAYYKRSFALFGHQFNFGCPAKEKKEATDALKLWFFGKADVATLKEHHKAIQDDNELEQIYQHLIKVK